VLLKCGRLKRWCPLCHRISQRTYKRAARKDPTNKAKNQAKDKQNGRRKTQSRRLKKLLAVLAMAICLPMSPLELLRVIALTCRKCGGVRVYQRWTTTAGVRMARLRCLHCQRENAREWMHRRMLELPYHVVKNYQAERARYERDKRRHQKGLGPPPAPVKFPRLRKMLPPVPAN
jgi:hypothetical protein